MVFSISQFYQVAKMMLVSNVNSRLNTKAKTFTSVQRLEVTPRHGVMTYGATTIGIIAQIAEVCIAY